MHDHNNYIMEYQEETDKHYFSNIHDLYGAICAECKKDIVKDTKPNCIVASEAAPVHVCIGHNKYQC